MELYKPSQIKEIQERFGFQFTKSLGQNFLIDGNIVRQIVEKTDVHLDTLVIEIGPGIGVITRELSEDACRVIAIEIDKKLLPILDYTLGDCPNFQVINEDVLKVDLNKLIAETKEEIKRDHEKIVEELIKEDGETREGAIKRVSDLGYPDNYKVRIVGNLPYYITTPIIMKILEEHVECDSITVMMQKEVADRIKAKPGKEDYGALTIAVQYYCDVETALNVPKEVFMPRPQVDSTVLILKPRKEQIYKVRNEKIFFDAVKAGFGQRRKTLNNSLMGIKNITKEIVKESLEKSGIDPMRRAETLSIEEFALLSNEIDELLRKR